jgi:hypothetical protein
MSIEGSQELLEYSKNAFLEAQKRAALASTKNEEIKHEADKAQQQFDSARAQEAEARENLSLVSKQQEDQSKELETKMRQDAQEKLEYLEQAIGQKDQQREQQRAKQQALIAQEGALLEKKQAASRPAGSSFYKRGYLSWLEQWNRQANELPLAEQTARNMLAVDQFLAKEQEARKIVEEGNAWSWRNLRKSAEQKEQEQKAQHYLSQVDEIKKGVRLANSKNSFSDKAASIKKIVYELPQSIRETAVAPQQYGPNWQRKLNNSTRVYENEEKATKWRLMAPEDFD